MTSPKRIQLSRKKGWRKPANCVVVSRPGKWGNPYVVGGDGPWGVKTRAEAVKMFQAGLMYDEIDFPLFAEELRGKDLACWCPLDQPCHADVLIDMANPKPKQTEKT